MAAAIGSLAGVLSPFSLSQECSRTNSSLAHRVRSPITGCYPGWGIGAGPRPAVVSPCLRAAACSRQAEGLLPLRACSVADAERLDDSSLVGNPAWPEFRSRYELGRFLGRGSFGTVNLALDKLSGEEFAVKCIPKQREGTNAPHILEKILLEVDMLQALQNCPQAIGFEGVFQDSDHVYVVTEACYGGDLEGLLRAQGPLRERGAAKVVHDVLKVLAECHRQGICYNDVKPANFLLKSKLVPGVRQDQSSELEVKVVDFGCSQRVLEGGKLAKRTGTPLYMAPELFMRYYGIESDLWGLGMMCYQLLCGKLPFWESMKDRNPFSIMSAILNEEVKFEGPVWEGISAEAINLIKLLLDRDYNSRLTASEALQHAWFTQQCADQEGCVVANNVVHLKHPLSAATSYIGQDI